MESPQRSRYPAHKPGSPARWNSSAGCNRGHLKDCLTRVEDFVACGVGLRKLGRCGKYNFAEMVDFIPLSQQVEPLRGLLRQPLWASKFYLLTEVGAHHSRIARGGPIRGCKFPGTKL
jgi:hypothetical protein